MLSSNISEAEATLRRLSPAALRFSFVKSSMLMIVAKLSPRRSSWKISLLSAILSMFGQWQVQSLWAVSLEQHTHTHRHTHTHTCEK